jgi:hypothetical protein
MILGKRALENGNFIVQQKLGDAHLTVSDLKEKLQNGDDLIVSEQQYGCFFEVRRKV